MGKRLTATREFFAFYRAQFAPTTIAEWGRAMALGTTLATLCSGVYYLFKKYIVESGREATIVNLWWQFALIFFVCLVVARLILAPYRKYKEIERQSRLRMRRRRDKWRQIINALREKHRAEESKLKEKGNAEVSKVKAERDAFKSQLDEERTEPYIKGTIKEVHIESWFPPGYAKQGSIVWHVTVHVHIVNLRAATTTQDYHLALSVRGHEYKGHSVSLASYYITRRVERPVHLETYIDEVEEDLVDLRQFNLTPLERNLGREGWLRFKVSGIPILEEDAPQRSDQMSLVLYVVDATGESHPIPASSPWNQTGEIRRRR
jgi:hypothetical protein